MGIHTYKQTRNSLHDTLQKETVPKMILQNSYEKKKCQKKLTQTPTKYPERNRTISTVNSYWLK